jgi:hypothetical protein
MNVDLKGTIKVIYAEKQVTETLKKRELVITIEEDTQYPQDIIVQAINNKVDLLNDFKEGFKVQAKCNLKGKATTDGKYFNQMTLWEITNVGKRAND